MVESISLTSITTGANGPIIEVHLDPVKAYSEGSQSLKLEKIPTLSEIPDPSPN